jgi:hypothetical protein
VRQEIGVRSRAVYIGTIQMKKLILIVLLIFSSFAHAEWVYVGKKPGGDKFWWNTNAEKTGNVARVWVRRQHGVKEKGSWSSSAWFEIKCGNPRNKYRFLLIKRYKDKNWKTLLDQPVESLNKWANAVPDTFSGLLTEHVCR